MNKLYFKYTIFFKYIIYIYLYHFLYNFFYKKIKKKFIKLFNKNTLFFLPYISEYIKKDLYKITKSLEDNLNSKSTYNNLLKLPSKAFSEKKVNNRILLLKSQEQINNKISGTIYSGDITYKNKLLKIFNEFSWTNPLHPDLFSSIREMEIDIINMARNIFHGDSKCSGNVTYGGTESIILACKTYRDWAYNVRGIFEPNIVAIESVHPAFDKACFYFNISLIKVPINLKTGTARVSDINRYINSNTICLVGSAPSYPHGIIDPIEDMNYIALRRGIGLHVDCCLGGFLLPFLYKSGKIKDKFDFRLKGVTSISADTHKYGYSLKGSSILLFKNYHYKKYQHYVNEKWSGGMYATPTVMGSKSGALIASTWAAMLYNGYEKYTRFAINIQNNLFKIIEHLRDNEDIRIIGNPYINVVAFMSDSLNIYSVVSEMKKMDWDLSVMQNPPAFHFCITHNHNTIICDNFIKDLLKSIEIVKKNGDKKLDGTLAVYGSSTGVKKTVFLGEIVNNFIQLLSRKTISNKYN